MANNFRPTNLFCGPNFHNDFPATDSLDISQMDFRAAARDERVRIVLSPPGGEDPAGVGRLKIFSVRLSYVKNFIVNLNGLTVQNAGMAGAFAMTGASSRPRISW